MGYPGQPGPPGDWPGQQGPHGPQQGGPPPGYGGPPPGYGPPPGQPGGYPPQGPPPGYGGGYGGPPPGYGPPKKSKTKLILGLVGGGLFFIGVVLLLVFVVFGAGAGGPGSTPQATAEAVVEAFNNQDADAVNALACQELRDQQDEAAAGEEGPLPTEDGDPAAEEEFTVTLGDVRDNGDGTATADVTSSEGGPPLQIKLVEEEGSWYYCGFDIEVPELPDLEGGG